MFKYENQGTNTYLVYEVEDKDNIDTMSLGMLTNNKIPGLAQTLFMQMDNQKFIKYNVSAKISVRQFFSGMVNKKRLLGVFKGVIKGLLSAEDYMLDSNSIVLDMDYIFADVSTCEATLIYIPISNDNTSNLDLGMFFKNIMMNTQFDPTENSEHVAKIFNFLNSSPTFSLADFKALIDSLERNSDSVVSVPVQSQVLSSIAQPGPTQPKAEHPQPIANTKPVSSRISTPPVTSTQTIPIIQKSSVQQRHVTTPPMPSHPRPNSVNSATSQPNVKKISMLGLLMHYSKENAELYKVQKAAKKGQIIQKKAVELPNQTKSQNRPEFAVPGMHTSDKDINIPVQQAPSASQQPGVQKKTSISAVDSVNNSCMTQHSPTVKHVMSTVPQEKLMDFGETTVLGGTSGETTVLNDISNDTCLDEKKAYIIRVSNNEKIEINKPVFRIGKEKSYVDYFIGDNSYISRGHANIIQRDGKYYIIDNNSRNHTYVNGNSITSSTEVEIHSGDSFKLANEAFEFKLF